MSILRFFRSLPVVVASCFILGLTLGFLPSDLLGLALVVHLGVGGVLASGAGDEKFSRLSVVARAPTSAELELLAPVISLVIKAGWSPRQVLILRRAGVATVDVSCRGRGTVILAPWVSGDLDDRRYLPAHTAALIAHAMATHNAGPSHLDLASRWLRAPATAVGRLLAGVARAVGGAPFAQASWALRFIPGGVAVVQGTQPGGDPLLGVAVGMLVAATYLVPWCDVKISRRLCDIADRAVGDTFLGRPLCEVLRASSDPERLERSHRIRCSGENKVDPGKAVAPFRA